MNSEALLAYINSKKALELAQALSNIGRFLSLWDCTTGLPKTNPAKMPYTIKNGDYYIVDKVGSTNYKPNGSSYSGTASTTTETGAVTVLSMYYYDGTNWMLLPLDSLHLGGTTLDNPIVCNKCYNLGTITSLSFTLPTGIYNDFVYVSFSCGATAFTPSVTGTFSGDSITAVEPNKTTEYMFWNNGSKWILSTLFY